MKGFKEKKFKVTFLIDKNNNWIEQSLIKYKFNLEKKYSFHIQKNYKKIKNQDIVIALSYTKILPKSFLTKNHLNIVVHSSKLPRDKGFSPVFYQVLRGENTIFLSLIEMAEKVDSGDILFQTKYKLNSSGLNEEIREKQANATFKIIKKFLTNYPNIHRKKQIGKESFNKRRTYFSNKLNIDKTIKSQFNIMRVAHNEYYPINFNYKNKIYILKIYKKEP
ncbi:formyltransferase family protein [Candidatus Pelagibacter bacterium]|nr:formyltransferase family protein [Candidatus Pelagibacter bacterium]